MIVTNNHVVADAKSLSVGFVDGKSASATIRGTDSDADLAVVEVDTKNMKSSTLKKIAVITLGDSSKLQTGCHRWLYQCIKSSGTVDRQDNDIDPDRCSDQPWK